MRLFRQLELDLQSVELSPIEDAIVVQALRLPNHATASGALALQLTRRRDYVLEHEARELLRLHGAGRVALEIRIEWNPRLRTCAGRVDYRAKLISLNPLLHAHGQAEIDRTLRHELAHLLAQFRAGRKRIFPHGREWRRACEDLGIGDETRCHTLPFPVSQRRRRFVYRCPNCRNEFARVRKIRRAVACLVCCRKYNRGKFDPRFKLRLLKL